MLDNQRIFKEPNKINFPDDADHHGTRKSNIYELLLQTKGDYKQVSQILDRKIDETNRLIKELTENINEMPDQSFDEKLRKLKNDNSETMLLCDEFRKIASRKEREHEANVDGANNDNGKLSDENKKKLYQKPPQIPKPNRNFMISNIKDINNHHVTSYDDFDDTRSLDSYRVRNKYGNTQKSWKEYPDIDDEEDINRREKNYKREAAMERLTRSKSSLGRYPDTMDKHNNPFDPDTLVSKWRHRVTVPEPFEMTIRDETKRKCQQFSDKNNKLRKSRTLEEFEAERAEKERQEIEETKKQFKANPVPAHVYIPLYETMQEETNQRRQIIREYNKEILKSIEKPFKFYKREMEKQKQKSYVNNSKNTSNKLPLKSYHSERQKTIIRAKEVPKSINESTAFEKMKEEEIFRLIKAEMRSKRLLEESKMPGNMAERQRIQEEKRKKKELKNSDLSLRLRSKSADSSRNHKSVPDFSKIHREWEEELRMSYKEPHVTQPKPFNLQTELRPFTRPTNNFEDFTVNETPIKNEWNKSIMAALEIAKPSTNKSTMLRDKALKNKMIDDESKMHKKAIEKLSKKKREMDVSDKIRKSLDIEMLPKGEDKRRQKTKELKIQNELRKETYQKELEEMKMKVNQKPLLFESVQYKKNLNNGVNKENHENQSIKSKRLGNYTDYDERNHFGDPGSYRSGTDASSIDGMRSSQKSNHSRLSNNINEEYMIDYE